MKITSMDVHRKEFGHAVRGYREDEVDDFLDAIAVELDKMQAEIEDLKKRAKQSESSAINFEAEKNTINNALLTAQRASDDLIKQAEIKSERILVEADERAEKKLVAAKNEKDEILEELMRLKKEEKKFREEILAHAEETIARVKDEEKKFRGGILAHAEETIAQVKEVKAPAIPATAKSRQAESSKDAAKSEAQDSKRARSRKDRRNASREEASKKKVAPAQKPKPVPPKAAPQIKKEDGLGQYGEMEVEDLDSID